MKKYVNVIAKFDTDGNVIPIAIENENGNKKIIDKIIDSRQACSLKSGGTGYRYTVKIESNLYFLFCEGQNIRNFHAFSKWFIEKI